MPSANVHLRFEPVTPGCTVRFRGDYDGEWTTWPQDHPARVTHADGVWEAAYPKPLEDWRDFHFHTARHAFRKGVTYRFSFEAERLDRPGYVLPCVYSVSPEGVHRAVPFDGRDVFLSSVGKAAAAGVDFVSFPAEVRWGEKVVDFSALDALIGEILSVNPHALLVPRLPLDAPAWWLRDHPDDRMAFGDGTRPQMASVSSRAYRRLAVDFAERVVRHLMERFPRHFAGIHPVGQNTGEWFYFQSWKRQCGYDPRTLEAFRAHLGDADATVPTPQERLAPVLDERTVAFNRFLQLEMSDFVAEVARSCQRATEGKKLVVLFYGYTWEFASHRLGPANSGHYGVGNLLRKADGAIDVLCSPISYHDRRLCGSAPNMSAGETVMRHGILWLNEDDSRTHLDLRSGTRMEGSAVDLEGARRVLLRDTAQAAIRGFGCWWMDLMGRGWHDSPELWDVQKALMPVERALLGRERPYAPDVALVLDEEQMIRQSAAEQDRGKALGELREVAARSSVPFGQYLRNVDREIPAKIVLDGSKPVTATDIWDMASAAGIHRYLPREEVGAAVVWAAPVSETNGYASVQALRDGELHVLAPVRTAAIFDALTGEEVGSDGTAELTLKAGDVRVLSWREKREERRPDVLCVYYPEWHAYPEGDAMLGKGRTEWENVKENPTRFPGHDNPIVPLDGYLDDSKPADVAKEIDYAADAGIDVFLYDWYWADHHPIQHEALEQGYMNAPNRDRVRFALMWAYHHRGPAPKRPTIAELVEAARTNSLKLYWKVSFTVEEWQEAIRYCIRHYFRHPNYYRKDGKLFYSMYNGQWFVQNNGGVEGARKLLAWAQEEVRKEGLPPIHFSAMIGTASAEPGDARDLKAVTDAGFDSVSVYSIGPAPYRHVAKKPVRPEYAAYLSKDRGIPCVVPYEELMEEHRNVNGALAAKSEIPYIPLVSRGWDSSFRCSTSEPFPWTKVTYPYLCIVAGATPDLFAAHIRESIEIGRRAKCPSGILLINAWNEYTEGSWLLPDRRNGDGYLRAIESVVGRARAEKAGGNDIDRRNWNRYSTPQAQGKETRK